MMDANPHRIEDKLFHARIFRGYIEYLKDVKSWSQNQITEFLNELDVNEEKIYDDRYWFSVTFSDKFYDLIVKKTGDTKIAYNAGLYIKKNAFSAAIYQLMRGLLSVGNLYRLLGKFTPHFTKAAKMKVVHIDGNQALIENRPNPGFKERAYMCENRTAILKALPTIYNLPLAEIKHTFCTQRGDDYCQYSATWKETFLHKYNFTILGTLFLGSLHILIYYHLPHYFLSFLSFSLICYLNLYLGLKLYIKTKELRLQSRILDQSVEGSERRNMELEVLSEIARLTHQQLDLHNLSEILVRNVCQLIGYDRSILLLVNSEKNSLEVTSHYGFEDEMSELLDQTSFNIRQDNDAGWLIKVVNSKKPVFINNVDDEIKNLSVRSKTFTRYMKSTSFIAVPLFNKERDVVGVLAIDNIDQAKKLKTADQDLLMTLADHLGIAIEKTKLLSQLTQSLDRLERASNREKHLRDLFQKFIPTQMAEYITNDYNRKSTKDLLQRSKKQSIAILFLDIFSFSTIVEDFTPERVIEFLNIVFSGLEPIIKKHGGFVDKFLGDGFLAVFDQNHRSCDQAIHSSLDIIETLETINKDLNFKNYPSIQVGIGINFGSAILGNIGSPERVNFTVIGESVNLASRLESYTRQLGPNTICAGASVRFQTQTQYDWKSLGPIAVKGYQSKIEIFQILTPKKNVSSGRKASEIA